MAKKPRTQQELDFLHGLNAQVARLKQRNKEKKTPDINKILREDGRSCARGAPMGDSNVNQTTAPLYLQRVRFIDGDYGPDGTYWGASHGEYMYCAFNPEDDRFAAGHGTRIYTRAGSREEAKELIRVRYPDALFIH